jgi:hypothetical protein
VVVDYWLVALEYFRLERLVGHGPCGAHSGSLRLSGKK